MMNIALLTAAGIGSRMGQDIPKQFIHIDNKPILIYTMEAFQKHPGIDAILVVTLPAWMDVVKAYARQFGITKLRWIEPGGISLQESILHGLRRLESECQKDDIVLVHDGNRCMVSAEIISDSLATFRKHGGAVAAIPCVEAVFESEDDGASSRKFIPREKLYRTQTPHTYTLGKLLWAHREAANRHIYNTAATCALMNELGEAIYFSKGSEKNLKITTIDDIAIFQALLHTQKEEWLK